MDAAVDEDELRCDQERTRLREHGGNDGQWPKEKQLIESERCSQVDLAAIVGHIAREQKRIM